MKIKSFLKQHKFIILIAVLIIVIAFLWSFKSSFSEDTSSSDWNGVIARSFASGTGTENNPYIISNASEYAYFKSLLEGSDASLYATKNYLITNGFNYGDYDISINNNIPFSGVLDGNGNLIYNASMTNALFNKIEAATIKNISFDDISSSLINESGALFANEIIETSVDMLLFTGNANIGSETSFGGFVYESENNKYSNIVLNYEIVSESTDIYKFGYNLLSDEGNNILINNDNYESTKNKTDIIFELFDTDNDDIILTNSNVLDRYTNDNYKITIINNQFIIEKVEDLTEDTSNQDIPLPSKAPSLKGVASSSSITEHISGIDGTTIYINDFTQDYNYFKGLNFTEIRDTSIPNGTSTTQIASILKEKDLITIRGKGRFEIEEILGNSKKGKIIIKVFIINIML